MKKSLGSQAGFTLIEIMAVIILIALAIGLVGPEVFKRLAQGRQDSVRSQIAGFDMTLASYRMDNGTYPTTDQGLEALRTRPVLPPVPEKWNGPYLSKEVPVDPWGNPYRYICPGKRNPEGYDLYSLGSDGMEGGIGEAADITNW